jgi:hypothetical protein
MANSPKYHFLLATTSCPQLDPACKEFTGNFRKDYNNWIYIAESIGFVERSDLCMGTAQLVIETTNRPIPYSCGKLRSELCLEKEQRSWHTFRANS